MFKTERGNTIGISNTFYGTDGLALTAQAVQAVLSYLKGGVFTVETLTMASSANGSWNVSWNSRSADAGTVYGLSRVTSPTPFAAVGYDFNLIVNSSNY